MASATPAPMADVSSAPARLLLVLAHPDDESFACGGTIARAAASGCDVTLLCATRGGSGLSHPSTEEAREALMQQRVRELQQACRLLGVSRVEVRGYVDGAVQWADPGALEREIAAAVAEIQPHAVITFGPDGLYWHADHIAVGARTRAALEIVGGAETALYHVHLDRDAIAGFLGAVRQSHPDADESLWGVPAGAFGLLAPPTTLVVDVRPWIDVKLAALRCHASQLGPTHPLALTDAETAAQWLGCEYFTLAPESRRDRSFLDGFGA